MLIHNGETQSFEKFFKSRGEERFTMARKRGGACGVALFRPLTFLVEWQICCRQNP